MKLKQNKTKRRRGIVLTLKGLQRLQEAIRTWNIRYNKGDRLNLEQLSSQINISTKTLGRLQSLNKGVDQKTLKLCFHAFNLELHQEDYIVLQEDNETQTSDFLSESSNIQRENLSQLPTNREENVLLYPDGPVLLNSPFYIERPPIEELVYQKVTQPGCIIRIYSPKQMGKTSLVLRLLAFARTQAYRTVNINCHQLTEQCLTNLNKLLRCLCWQIATELGIEPNIDEIWDDEVGCKLSCSFYIQNYLLKQSQRPIVLVLSEVERFFGYPQIAHEFFALLHSWCNESRQNDSWQNLRLVVVYSTEKHISLDINRFPFNIGLPIRLNEFTQQQVEKLAKRYRLEWTTGKESAQLMSLVGGHPALIQLAMFYLCSENMTLEDMIHEALANGGIYRHYLWQHWVKLQANPNLMKIYTELVEMKQGMVLNPMDIYKLENLGLICFAGDRILPRCELYRTYFAKQLSTIS